MSVLWRETKDVMVSQLNGNIKQTTTTTIQNPTSIHNPITILRPIQNQLPGIQTLLECSLLRAFVAPPITATPGSNHLLHLLPITCFRDRQKRHANLMGAGPRPTHTHTQTHTHRDINTLMGMHSYCYDPGWV